MRGITAIRFLRTVLASLPILAYVVTAAEERAFGAGPVSIIIDSPQTVFQSVGGPDTLTIVAGGSITSAPTPPTSVGYGVLAFDNASVSMLGGTIIATGEPVYGVQLRAGSDFFMSDGVIIAREDDRSNGIDVAAQSGDSSIVTITGGSISAIGDRSAAMRVRTFGNGSANVKITGGLLQSSAVPSGLPRAHALELSTDSGVSPINVLISNAQISSSYGSAIQTSGNTAGDISVDIKSGVIEGLQAIVTQGLSVFTISGGTLRGEANTIAARGRAQINILGGKIETNASNDFSLTESAVLNLFLRETQVYVNGNPFNGAFGVPTPILAESGTLTGKLLDGTEFEYEFTRASTASINIIGVPEPCTLTSTFVAALFSVAFFRRRLNSTL